MFNLFAAESGTSVPLSAEPVFTLFGLHITNSMLFGLVMAVVVVGLFAAAVRRSTVRPGSRLAFAVEQLMEFVLQLGEENLGSRAKAIKHMPLLLTLFTFILFSNLSGLLPGVGTINVATGEGQVPLFRAFTSDLNATLAMAILTIGTVQFYAVKELGIVKHFKHYFTDKPWNPMNLFIGTIEVMGEFIRIITLSMRLFGVIYAGEVLLRVIGQLAGNYAWAATFPVYLMEVFFSVIQAYLFMMLAMVYLSIATHDEEHTQEDHSTVPVNPAPAVTAKE